MYFFFLISKKLNYRHTSNAWYMIRVLYNNLLPVSCARSRSSGHSLWCSNGRQDDNATSPAAPRAGFAVHGDASVQPRRQPHPILHGRRIRRTQTGTGLAFHGDQSARNVRGDLGGCDRVGAGAGRKSLAGGARRVAVNGEWVCCCCTACTLCIRLMLLSVRSGGSSMLLAASPVYVCMCVCVCVKVVV